MKRGELVYAPAEVMLCKFEKDSSGFEDSTINSYLKLEKPVHLLITKEQTLLYEVLYENDTWYVKKNEVYEVKYE